MQTIFILVICRKVVGMDLPIYYVSVRDISGTRDWIIQYIHYNAKHKQNRSYQNNMNIGKAYRSTQLDLYDNRTTWTSMNTFSAAE